MKTQQSFLFHWLPQVLGHFRSHIHPERYKLALIATLSIGATAASTLLIWHMGRAVSEIAAGHFEQLGDTLLIIALLALLQQSLRLGHAYLFQVVSLRFVDRVRGRLLDHVLTLSFPIVQRFAKGDLLARIGNDVDRLLTFFVNAPLNVFSSLILVTVYGAMLFWIDWRLALIAVGFAPLFFVAQRYAAPRVGQASSSFTREKTRLFALEEQTLANLRGLSAFTSEKQIKRRHQDQFDLARSWNLKLRRIRMLNNALTTFLIFLAAVTVVFAGISAVESGSLQLGGLVSFLFYLRFAIFPIRNIAHIPVTLAANRPAAERVIELLTAAPEVDDSSDKPSLLVQRGEIRFDGVTFAYPGTSRNVLSDVTLSIGAGESVALVGPSGAGKSTFANLLLRFYDPQRGSITIDGADIRTVSLASLRKHVAIVWQEPLLVDGTLRENLMLAHPDANAQQLRAACEASDSMTFIDALPDGLDTLIGPNGVLLSVGQRQRVAIAQAFLRDAPILILDEASSALDSQSERAINASLQTLRESRTTLTIAHRHSSVRSADRVFYFTGEGAITVGTHDELLARIPRYEEAVAWQTRERISAN